MRIPRIFYIIFAIVFVVAALSDSCSNPNFANMTIWEQIRHVRLVISLGLFIGGFISFDTLKSQTLGGILIGAAVAILISMLAGC